MTHETERKIRRAISVAALLFVGAVFGSVACTPAQLDTVRTVWDVAKPILDCLLGSPYDDAETAIAACGVKEADKPYARSLLDKKSAIRAEGYAAGTTAAVAKVGTCKR